MVSYRYRPSASVRNAPCSRGSNSASGLLRPIAERIGRSLERAGLITRDVENAYLAFDPSTLKTLPENPERRSREVAESSGFSLHAGIAAKAGEREKVERLARYIARPPLAAERLALTESGQARLTLKTPYRDGTTHVIFEPEDFIARLAALVQKPRARPPQGMLPI